MPSLLRFANGFARLLPGLARLTLALGAATPLVLAVAGPVGCGSNVDMVPLGSGGTAPGTGGVAGIDGGEPEGPGAGGVTGEPDASEPEVQASICPTYALIPLTLPSADGAQPAIVWNGTSYYAVWSGAPVGTGNTAGNIFGAVLDVEGNKVGDDILIADTANLATSPEVVAVPAGPGVDAGFTVVFEDCIGPSSTGCAGGAAVHSVLLGADGKPLGPPVMVSPAVQEQRRPYVAAGHGNVYVTFRDVLPGPPPRTVARLVRLDAVGAPVGEGVVVDNASNGRYPHVAVSPTGVALAYEREKTTSEIVLALFDPALTPVIEVPVRTGVMGDASNPVVQWNATRWVIAWEDERDDEAKIYATVVDADGMRIGPTGCVGAACAPQAAYDENGNWPTIASGDMMTSLIGFYGYPGRRIFLARLEASGNLKMGQVVLGVGKFPSVTYNSTDKVYAVAYEDEVNHRVMLGRFKCTD